jgi:dolichyl-phosphate-mannose--protein O-mannosyl transferase
MTRKSAAATAAILFILLGLFGFAAAEKSSDHLKVTCGSAIKLTHKQTGAKLHSHEVKYGSGSGQQVFTPAFNRSI